MAQILADSKSWANYTQKKILGFLTQFGVKYGQTQPLGYIFKLHF